MSASDLWRTIKLLRGTKSVSNLMPIQLFEENLPGPCGPIMSYLSSLDENHDDFLLKKIVLSELNRASNISKDTFRCLDGIRNSHTTPHRNSSRLYALTYILKTFLNLYLLFSSHILTQMQLDKQHNPL
uniref:Uncharacterized protein n=1 Tax=Glossina brevipalpis TaxID=37001 RepID=A0A1A9W7N7_9MUSC